MPVFAGASPYSLTHRVISSDTSLTFTAIDADGTNSDTTAGLDSFFKKSGYYDSLWNNPGVDDDDTYKGSVQETLFGCWATAAPGAQQCLDASLGFFAGQTLPATLRQTGLASRYFFAQGTCGAPLPGSTKITTNVDVLYPTTAVGARTPLVRFFMQPGDSAVEPHRRLLSKAEGGSEAVINFDPTLHPTKDFSYPVQFFVELPPCTNACTGDLRIDLSKTNLYCDAQGGRIYLNVQTDLGARVCACPEGWQNRGGTCAI
jgi:hypothetical protein